MNQLIVEFLGRTDVWAFGLGIAAFLTLFWMVRGAPLGQRTADEPDDAPPRPYRDRMVAASVLAFLMVVAAAYVALVYGIPWALPLFVVGFGAVLLILKRNQQYRHVSPTLRRVVQFSNSALTASLVGGILVVLNIVAFRYGGEAIDFTSDRSHSLSSLTVGQIKGLEKPLRLTVFLGGSDRATRRLDRVKQLLELFKAQNPEKITVESINPFTDPGAFEALVKRVPDAAILTEGGVALESGEGESATRGVVSSQELFQSPGQGPNARKDSYVTTFAGEDVLTSTLIRIREGKISRVAFTTGHGEPAVDEMESSRPGLGLWKRRMASVGLAAIPVNLMSEEIAPDVALVVIVAPSSPFKPEEAKRLRDHMLKQKPVLLLLGLGESSGLEELLKIHNIIVSNEHIFDPKFNLRGPSIVATPPLLAVGHPVIDALAGQQILIPNPRPIDVLGTARKRGEKPSAKVNPGVDAMPILWTGPESFASASQRFPRFDPAKDRAGPLVVGVAAMTLPELAGGASLGKPLLMVYSSPYLADNQSLTLDPSNLDLLMNSINWLRGRAELQGIAPKTHVAPIFTADPNLRMRLHIIPTLLAGLLIVGLGILTYLTRRQ